MWPGDHNEENHGKSIPRAEYGSQLVVASYCCNRIVADGIMTYFVELLFTCYVVKIGARDVEHIRGVQKQVDQV